MFCTTYYPERSPKRANQIHSDLGEIYSPKKLLLLNIVINLLYFLRKWWGIKTVARMSPLLFYQVFIKNAKLQTYKKKRLRHEKFF